MQDSTYYEYLADEVTVQRNGAMDELAKARTEVRLSNITISSLETQLFHAKHDIATMADELDAITEHALSLGGYCEHLEQNADAALAASQQRLRERIDTLEAENARLESLVDWDYVDHLERIGQYAKVEEKEEEPVLLKSEPVLTPTIEIDAGGAPGQSSQVLDTVFGGDWIETPEQPKIIIPTAEEVQAVGIAGAPGQNSSVIGTVGSGVGNIDAAIVDRIVEKNSGDVLPVTSTPVDNLTEIVLEESGDTNADRKIRERIAELKGEA